MTSNDKLIIQDELVKRREELLKKSYKIARSAARIRKEIEDLDELIRTTVDFGIGDYINYTYKLDASNKTVDMYMHIKRLETPYRDYVIGFRSACVELGNSPCFIPNYVYYFKKNDIANVKVIDRKEYLKAFNKLKKNI